MTILDAAFWAVGLVVVASGATKLAEPGSFAEALDALRPGGGAGAHDHVAGHGGPSARLRWLAILVGLVELALGLAALAIGGSLVAWAVAAAYAAFTVVVLLARRRGLTTCGCFGARSGAPRGVHAALNAASAVVAAAAALRGPPPVADGLEGLAGPVAVLVVLGVLGAAATVVVVDTR